MDEIKHPNFAFKISIIAAVMLCSLLLYLGITDNVEKYEGRQKLTCKQITEYSCREKKNEQAPIGVVKEYLFRVDSKLSRDMYLSFYTVHQYTKVFIENELVYSLMPSEEYSIIKTVGSNWSMIPIYREDAGKEIRVEIIPVYESFKDREPEFVMGSQLEVYKQRLSRDWPQLVLSVIAIFVGIVFICIAIYNMIRRRGFQMISLGLFSIIVGIWRLTDTRFTPFLLEDKPTLLFYTSISMLMIGIIPLFYSVKVQFSKESKRVMDKCCVIIALICIVQLILQFTGIFDLRELLIVTHGVIILGGIVITGTLIYEKKHRSPKSGIVRKLPLICVGGALMDILVFYIKGNSSNLNFSLLSLLIFIIFSGILMLFDYSEQRERLKEQESKLAESRISLMMSQIQPHFLYNSITAIRELCRQNPEQARIALGDFSNYLRGNMDALTSKRLIHFSKELSHIETYLNLEKLRFGEQLNVIYDIREEDFYLPSLMIQPLVENAVKHGICETAEGGTITLRTWRDGNKIHITIEDDGKGIDINEPLYNDYSRSHVGLQNVRMRLQELLDGEMKIESAPGKGTIVRICFQAK